MSTREPILCGCAERALAQVDAALLALWHDDVDFFDEAKAAVVRLAIAAARQRQEGRG